MFQRFLGSLVALSMLGACDSPGSGAADVVPDTAPETSPDVVEETTAPDATPDETAPDTTAEETAEPDTAVDTTPEVVEPVGLPILGAGSHSPAALTIETLLDSGDGLVAPRDVAFNPDVVSGVSQLFVCDADMNTIVVTNPGEPTEKIRQNHSFGADHFMSAPVSIAFGDSGTFATISETDWVTQDTTPADFMGPTLWLSDSSQFDGGWATHMDMLHNSPNGVGIAADTGNAYWVFDGYHESLTWYDFQDDHGPGGEDHSDGIIVRWVQGEVGYVPGVTSDMELDHATGKLYVADTGNSRVAVLDTNSGTRGSSVSPNYDGASQYRRNGGVLTTLADLGALGATQPSGLVLHDGYVWVSDNATSRIYAFSYDTGAPQAPIDWLDLSSVVPAGQLGAMTFDAQDRLVVIDVDGARVLRITAPAP